MKPRSFLKEMIYSAMYMTGLPWLARQRSRSSLRVLTYHSFGAPEEYPFLSRLPLRELDKQLDHIKSNFNAVSLSAGMELLQNRYVSRPLISVTIDDGFADNYDYLFPRVLRRGIPITIFLATDYVDTGRLPWPTRLSAMLYNATKEIIAYPQTLLLSTYEQRRAAGHLLRQSLCMMGHAERDKTLEELEEVLQPTRFNTVPPLTWAQVREMSRAGVNFGAHTHYHGWLDRLNSVEIDCELRRSRKRIEDELGQPCDILAYPNGSWNPSVAAAAKRAGYKLALTQTRGLNRLYDLQPLALRRLQIPEDERIGTFACRVAGVAF